MNLETLLRLRRTIRVIGFDDAPFVRNEDTETQIAGIVCAGTRFEGMVWGNVTLDGWDATEQICQRLLNSKFLPQLHLLLLDGIAFGGFNLIDLPELSAQLNLPCVAVMRRLPKLDKIYEAMGRLPDLEKRLARLKKAGEIYQYSPFVFQAVGEKPEIIAATLQQLTDCGNVPEALRIAHLIGSAVKKGESGRSA